ncbi:hypothetical protein C8F04DRAFT_1247566 [Mycena alexandri]|uniref:Uncharacterized protein n=1 Tax=Mycena alexandri TaxID=1745969 RepID=A0AAD6XH74_9AGAR|nr:hypothetical protein C8F04DRAFT_1247566 [Mycena alexandri]
MARYGLLKEVRRAPTERNWGSDWSHLAILRPKSEGSGHGYNSSTAASGTAALSGPSYSISYARWTPHPRTSQPTPTPAPRTNRKPSTPSSPSLDTQATEYKVGDRVKSDAPTEDYSEVQQEINEDEDIELFDFDDEVSESMSKLTPEDLLASSLDDAIQAVVLALFQYEQTGHTTQKFFSARIAHLTYCGHGSLMLEIEHVLGEHLDWGFAQAHALVKKYHTNSFVMPLVAMFQLFTLLKIEAIFHEQVFFGKDIPPHLSPIPFVPSTSATLRRIAPSGFAHPPNRFREQAHDYLCWILSEPDLRERFMHHANGDLHWRPTPVKRLMDAKQLADLSLHNEAGSTTHKMLHKHLNYKLIPSAPPDPPRPLYPAAPHLHPTDASILCTTLLGIDAAHCFHTVMWPRCRATDNPLRKFVTFWFKEHVSPALQDTHVIIDHIASHSRNTAALHYNQDAGSAAGVSTNQVHLMLLIDEDGPVAAQYRALIQHYGVPDMEAPAGTTTPLTLDGLRGPLLQKLQRR